MFTLLTAATWGWVHWKTSGANPEWCDCIQQNCLNGAQQREIMRRHRQLFDWAQRVALVVDIVLVIWWLG